MLKTFQVLDSLIFSNLYISLGAMSLSYVLFKLAGIPVNYVILVPFFIIFVIYTFNGKTDTREDALSDSKKFGFNKSYNRYFLAFAFAGFGLLVVFSFIKGVKYGLEVLVPFVIGLLYSSRISLKSKMIRLKDILFFKNFIVAITWAFVTVIIPASFLNIPFTQDIYLLSFFIFSILLIDEIFFDIKDLKGDSEVGTKTIPAIYGISFTNKLLFFLNLTFVLILIIGYWVGTVDTFLVKIGIFSASYGFLYMLLYNLNVIEINKLSNIIVAGQFIAVGFFVFLITSL
ncbi:MAG: UbiA family prenyltransferase [Candidatus Methanoperedens sp.]|nr:UbiA family prenyltransferase [Candidatus Methanoperedens nitroreducens]MDJ1422819.1 UbiA family prenyltransferase [Candidatus Methanoperedens sp.]